MAVAAVVVADAEGAGMTVEGKANVSFVIVAILIGMLIFAMVYQG